MSFDVFDRHLNVNQTHLLEASAGTGKTFAIENIVVRLLLETDATLDQILVVTFTRAATRELKQRIRANIIRTLETKTPPDYLQALYEKGGEAKAKRALEAALFSYDQAQIFTIHGFCARLLENATDDSIDPNLILGVIRDFFRTGLRPDRYSVEQLFKHRDIESLEKKLYKAITNGTEIAPPLYFNDLLELFQKEKRNYSSSLILEDFHLQAPLYKGLTNIEFHRFAKIFDKEQWGREDLEFLIKDGLIILDPSQLKAKKQPIPLEQLHYPDFQKYLKRLQPIIERARSPLAIFASMAYDCQQLYKKVSAEEEMPIPDDLLRGVYEAMKSPDFANKVRKKYKAAIIDEFQDTDTIQWKIFQHLFGEHVLYLVGDPKQSIYGFRQADIYTYLSAAQTIPKHASLDTNYRSQPKLVQALNTLFNVPDFIQLPTSNLTLPYKNVKTSSIEEKQFQDDRKAVHFFGASGKQGRSKKWPTQEMNERYFFPFIAEEIIRLNVPLNDIAILVRDKFQATDLAKFLKKYKIPSTLQHDLNLADSPAFPILKELLAAILNPRDLSAVKTVLAGRLFCWSHERIRNLLEDTAFEELLATFYAWRKTLFNKNFALFFQEVLNDRLEFILAQESGEDLFRDLQHLSELITEARTSPESLHEFLVNENEKIRQNPDLKAVKILTMHMSKGLEFEIVFALGLASRREFKEELIPQRNAERPLLVPPLEEYSEAIKLHTKESDAEKMRLLYVAMTRAKQRLYLPIAKDSSPQDSPMELFLAKHGEFDFEKNGMSYSDLEKEQFQHTILKPSLPTLIPPKEIFFPRISGGIIASFSSLTTLPQGTENAPHDFEAQIKTPHTLPAGADTGILLHSILEKIPFDTTDITPFIQNHLQKHPLKPWQETITEIIQNALKAPLGDFTLSDVKHCYRELEFLYPYEGEPFPLPEGIRMENNFLKGFIDCVFMHQGKYYILDWKSNWLGPTIEDYRRENLEKAMEHYSLQASIYVEALRRYLKVTDQRHCFGGVYYLFLRGLSNDTGIYHWRPFA